MTRRCTRFVFELVDDRFPVSRFQARHSRARSTSLPQECTRSIAPTTRAKSPGLGKEPRISRSRSPMPPPILSPPSKRTYDASKFLTPVLTGLDRAAGCFELLERNLGTRTARIRESLKPGGLAGTGAEDLRHLLRWLPRRGGRRQWPGGALSRA